MNELQRFFDTLNDEDCFGFIPLQKKVHSNEIILEKKKANKNLKKSILHEFSMKKFFYNSKDTEESKHLRLEKAL